MRTRYYIATGILSYIVFLVATIPAAPVISMFDARLPLTIKNVSGTLWSGQAGTVDTDRDITLNNVQWSFLPSHLLLASLAIDVNAEMNDYPVKTRLSTGVSGNLAVSKLDMQLDAIDIEPLIALPIGELAGVFHLQINSARIKQGEVPRIDGTIDWKQATVTVAEAADLGDVSILVNENDQSPLTATINNKGGHLALNGNFSVTAQGDYSLQLTMKPNASASTNLSGSLAMFARKQRNGEFLLNNKGNLKQLGLM